MADTAPGVVSFTGPDGRTVWTAEGSPAHKEHLQAQAEQKKPEPRSGKSKG